MIDRALAERERRLRTELNLAFDKVCDVETRMQIINCILPVALKWGAVCANEALERAAQVIEGYKGGYTSSLEGDFLAPDVDGPWGLNSDFARIVRKLKAEG